MLKVNLLDYRYKKMKLIIQFETLGMVLLLIMLCCFLYLFHDRLNIDKEALNTEITVQTEQLKKLTARTKKVTEMESVKKRVNQILSDIERLKKNLEDASYFYDELRKRIPFTVWLTKISERPKMLILTGVAENQSAIADFMTSLEDHYKFSEIRLIESVRQRTNNKDYYRYIIEAPYKENQGEQK